MAVRIKNTPVFCKGDTVYVTKAREFGTVKAVTRSAVRVGFAAGFWHNYKPYELEHAHQQSSDDAKPVDNQVTVLPLALTFRQEAAMRLMCAIVASRGDLSYQDAIRTAVSAADMLAAELKV